MLDRGVGGGPRRPRRARGRAAREVRGRPPRPRSVGASPTTPIATRGGRRCARSGGWTATTTVVTLVARAGADQARRPLPARPPRCCATGPRRASSSSATASCARELEASAPARALGDRLVWAGFRRDMADVCFASDVVVLTSDNEGTPVSLIEAQAAADAGREHERRRRARRSCSTGRPGCWPSASRAGLAARDRAPLLDDRERAAAMAAAGREHVLATFGVERLVDDLDRLYRRLLRMTPRGRASCRHPGVGRLRRVGCREAVASVARAGASRAEVIVVDNASAEPLPALPGATRRPRPAAAVDRRRAQPRASRRSRAPLVVFLDADDLMLPGALAQLLAGLRDDEVAFAMAIVDGDTGGRHRAPRRAAYALARAPRAFALANTVWSLLPTQGATIMRTADVRAAGGYGDRSQGEDWALAAAIAWRGRVRLAPRCGPRLPLALRFAGARGRRAWTCWATRGSCASGCGATRRSRPRLVGAAAGRGRAVPRGRRHAAACPGAAQAALAADAVAVRATRREARSARRRAPTAAGGSAPGSADRGSARRADPSERGTRAAGRACGTRSRRGRGCCAPAPSARTRARVGGGAVARSAASTELTEGSPSRCARSAPAGSSRSPAENASVACNCSARFVAAPHSSSVATSSARSRCSRDLPPLPVPCWAACRTTCSRRAGFASTGTGRPPTSIVSISCVSRGHAASGATPTPTSRRCRSTATLVLRAQPVRAVLAHPGRHRAVVQGRFEAQRGQHRRGAILVAGAHEDIGVGVVRGVGRIEPSDERRALQEHRVDPHSCEKLQNPGRRCIQPELRRHARDARLLGNALFAF